MRMREYIRENISIHAPRVGSDIDYDDPALEQVLFQSTLPVWGATLYSSIIG